MANLHVYPDRLEIRLTRAEKMLSLRRDDVVVDRTHIRSVAITQDPWIWIRGIRNPATVVVPLTLAIGVWKFHGGSDFVLVKGKQRAAVVIDMVVGEGQDATASVDATGRRSGSLDSQKRTPDGKAPTEPEFSRIIISTPRAVRLVKALRAGNTGKQGGEQVI